AVGAGPSPFASTGSGATVPAGVTTSVAGAGSGAPAGVAGAGAAGAATRAGAAAGMAATTSMTGFISGATRERASAAIMKRSGPGTEPRVTVPRNAAFWSTDDPSRISISFEADAVSPTIC